MSEQAWKWAPGMATTQGEVICEADEVDGGWSLRVDGSHITNRRHGHDGWVRYWYDDSQEREVVQPEEEPQPDKTDPATLGALLGQVREAWGIPDMHTMRAPGQYIGDPMAWQVTTSMGDYAWLGETEWGALVAAIEAAP